MRAPEDHEHNDHNIRRAEDDPSCRPASFKRKGFLEPHSLGVALISLGRFADALPIMRAQAEKDLPDARSWFQVGVAHAGMRDRGAAITAYRKAIELEPDYDLAWFNLGGEYWNNRNFAAAAETWREALRRFPTHPLASRTRMDFGKLLDLGS